MARWDLISDNLQTFDRVRRTAEVYVCVSFVANALHICAPKMRREMCKSLEKSCKGGVDCLLESCVSRTCSCSVRHLLQHAKVRPPETADDGTILQ